MSFYDRLMEKTVARDKTPKDVMISMDIAMNSYSLWKKRGTIPSADIVFKIADYLKTSARYLTTGIEDDGLPPRVAEMARKMALLPGDCLDGIEANINALYEKQRAQKANSSGS